MVCLPHDEISMQQGIVYLGFWNFLANTYMMMNWYCKMKYFTRNMALQEIEPHDLIPRHYIQWRDAWQSGWIELWITYLLSHRRTKKRNPNYQSHKWANTLAMYKIANCLCFRFQSAGNVMQKMLGTSCFQIGGNYCNEDNLRQRVNKIPSFTWFILMHLVFCCCYSISNN